MCGKSIRITLLAACSLALAAPVAANDGATGNPSDVGALQPGMQRSDDGSWYVGARAGATNLQRDHFDYGQIANDANDFSLGTVLGSDTTPDLNQDAWGGGSEFFAGMQLSEKHAVEARFGFALFDQAAKAHLMGGSDDNYYIPYLDAGRFPEANRERRAGVYGVRYRLRDQDVETKVNSDTTMIDVGFDFVSTHVDNEGCTFQSVIGPAFVYMNQDFHHTATGDAIGGWTKPTIVKTNEEVTEYYAGAKLGFRSSYALPQESRISLVLNGDVSLFYHHSDFDGRQNIANDLSIGAGDEQDDFATKFGALAGVDVQATDNLTIGAFYQFGAYLNAAAIDNPNLKVVDLEGDNRWAGDHAARLDDQTMFTHGASVRLVYRF